MPLIPTHKANDAEFVWSGTLSIFLETSSAYRHSSAAFETFSA
jgi:hypothetical protein